ncbi:MAG: hypothetical protein ACLP5H_30190 [Desulfomonilaceae bacterium]
MSRKTLLELVFISILTCGLLQVADADESGLQSCMTYCRLNFDPLLKPSENAQCVERCKREHASGAKLDWDRKDRMK